MVGINIIIIFLFLITLLAILKYQVQPILLILQTLFGSYIGIICLKNKKVDIIIYLMAIIFFVLGYLIIYKIKTKKIDEEKIIVKRTEERYKLYILEIIIIFFVIYHFMVGGIPLFQDNVEIDRFKFDSGLFGIPGRIYLFGLPFIYIYTYLFYDNKRNMNLLFITLFFIFARALGGIKSGVIEVLSIYIILRMAENNAIKLKNIVNKKTLLIGSFFLIFIFKLTQSYQTMSNISFYNFTKYILDRLTVIQAYPLDFLLKKYDSIILENTNLWNDFKYFFFKYTKIFGQMDNYFPTDNVVSANIYNTPLEKSSFIVPVTIGAFGEFYIYFGFFAIICMFICGIVYGYLIKKISFKNMSIFKKTNIIMLIIFFEGFITKGGFSYSLINFIFMSLLFMILNLFGLFIVQSINKSKKKGEIYEVHPYS